MKERPILFSGEMVRAILDGRKTQTRRIIKHPKLYGKNWNFEHLNRDGCSFSYPVSEINNQYCKTLAHKEYIHAHHRFGEIGDRLWVRETFGKAWELDEDGNPAGPENIYYRADGEPFSQYRDPETEEWRDGLRWKPSIHMPRAICRIMLEINDIRAERLQDISEKDSLSEGISEQVFTTNSLAYKELWNSINGKDSWDKHPWVWVIDFKRLK